MRHIQQFFNKVNNWIFQGARLPIIIVSFIIVAVTLVVVIVSRLNKPESSQVVAFVTVQGLSEDKTFENRQITIADGECITDIFSLKYQNIYEAFGKPLIEYNEFASFMGTRKTLEKSFHVTIDGVFESNLSQAYVYGGQTIVISYY